MSYSICLLRHSLKTKVRIEKTVIGVLETLRYSKTDHKRFSSRTERSEVRIEKTIAYVLSERLRHFVCNDKMCNSHCEVSMQSLT
jgi:hypothetical protein